MDVKTKPCVVDTFEKKFYSIDEIATLFGIPKSALYQLTAKKLIKHYKPGRRLYFTIEDVNNYILNSER